MDQAEKTWEPGPLNVVLRGRYMGSMKNRRIYSRSQVGIRSELVYEGITQTVFLKDVSLGGVYLTGVEGVPADSTCEVRLVLEGSEPPLRISMQGRVVRAHQDGVAFQIEHLDTGSVNHLRNLVLYNSEDPEQIMREWNQAESLRLVLQEILLTHLKPVQ